MSNSQLESKIRKLKKLKAQAAELEDDIETITDEIKSFMGDSETLNVGKHSVTWKFITGRRFDSNAFKADHETLYNDYKKESTTRRFVVVA